MRRLASIAALCSIAAIAAGCASPATHFYTLSVTAAPAGAPALRPSGLSVLVGPVSIPVLLDQPQIVVSAGPNQVSFDEFNRWATPLAADISRVLALDLMATLGTPRVALAQQTLNAEADYRVAIDVQGFESALGEAATLNAAWTVRNTRDGKTQTGRTSVREPANGNGFDAIAAAHSRALARLSQDIAGVVRAFEDGTR
jgi:uncharacterized lipoprotein YmbA